MKIKQVKTITGICLVVQWFKTCLQCRGRQFHPWSGNQDSTCSGVTKPTHRRPQARVLQLERSWHAATKSPCTLTKSLCATTKTQHSWINIIFKKKKLKASELSTTTKCIMWWKRLNSILFQLKILYKTFMYYLFLKQSLKILLKAKIIWSFIYICFIIYRTFLSESKKIHSSSAQRTSSRIDNSVRPQNKS